MLKAINGWYDDNAARGDFKGVRDYAKSGGAEAVVVWGLRWKLFEPLPGHYDESLWAELDTQIWNAYVDKRKIFLAVATECPPWAIIKQATGKVPPRSSGWRLPPDDVGYGGPWAKYLEKHLLRYPGIEGIIILNEPNVGFGDHPKPGRVAAEMIKTASNIWSYHKAKPLLMAPAVVDGPGSLVFAWEVLSGLGRKWKPPKGVRVVWAWHPYTDIKSGLTGIRSTTWKLIQLLRVWKWCNGPNVWMTESGYIFDVTGGPPPNPANYRYTRDLVEQEQDQLRQMTAFWQWCKKTGRVAMIATYEYRASLWGGWDSGLRRNDGTIRPMHEAWKVI